jgi:hypothetical protein
MRRHPYLRAYLAGIAVPTVLLPVAILPIYVYFQFYFEVPSQFVTGLPGRPLDRAILFPMAVVPNAWGLWNMLHLKLRAHWSVPLATHGALLPLLLMPGGFALARAFDVFGIQWEFALPMIPVGMALYYLVWKFVVGFLNEELGIG